MSDLGNDPAKPLDPDSEASAKIGAQDAPLIGAWFFCPPRYSFERGGIVAQIAKLTEQRVYYGDVQKAAHSHRRDRQSFVERRRCIALGGSETTARAVGAVWLRAKQAVDEDAERHAKLARAIYAKRDEEIAGLLAQGIAARSDETPVQAAQPEGQEPDPEGDAS